MIGFYHSTTIAELCILSKNKANLLKDIKTPQL